MLDTVATALKRADTWIYIIMALVYFSGIALCLYPLASVRRSLKQGIKRIPLRAASGAYDYESETYLRSRFLNDWWRRFVINWKEMRRTHGSVDLSSFLNLETCVMGPGHSQYAESLPGVMTSLGILGTFYGLITGIGQIATGGSVTEMTSSIAVLIDGMKTAFATSIIGVIGAVSFQLIWRYSVSITAAWVNHFVREFQTKVSGVYTEDTQMIQSLYTLVAEIRDLKDVLHASRPSSER